MMLDYSKTIETIESLLSEGTASSLTYAALECRLGSGPIKRLEAARSAEPVMLGYGYAFPAGSVGMYPGSTEIHIRIGLTVIEPERHVNTGYLVKMVGVGKGLGQGDLPRGEVFKAMGQILQSLGKLADETGGRIVFPIARS